MKPDEQETTKRPSVAKRVALAVVIVLAVLVGASAWYINDYYHADSVALAIVADENGSSDGVVVQRLSDKAIAFVPDAPVAGLIFYPGAKVQPESYAPLMQRYAEAGVLCILVKPLFNLALLDSNAAQGLQEQFPDIDTWLLAGHSMGGLAASEFTARNKDNISGVVFLASYPIADLSGFAGHSLSIAGSNDRVINLTSMEDSFDKLAKQTRQLVIEGGNHANVGNYGDQSGDGKATIPREEQQQQAVAATLELLAQ